MGIGLMSPMLWLGAFGRRTEVSSFRTFDTCASLLSHKIHTFCQQMSQIFDKCYKI